MLQWGHGEFTVETTDYARALKNFDPLQWGHGEFTVETPKFCAMALVSYRCFNGATVNSPWRPSDHEKDFEHDQSFNGATVNSPWRQHGPRDGRQRDPRFNGATVNSPWRQRVELLREVAGRASMGPR